MLKIVILRVFGKIFKKLFIVFGLLITITKQLEDCIIVFKNLHILKICGLLRYLLTPLKSFWLGKFNQFNQIIRQLGNMSDVLVQ